MRKLGCVGAVAAALLMWAGTAQADPFTVTSNTQSTRGVGNLWFNDLIKLNTPDTAQTKTYLADSIIIFGGDLVAVPNSAITVSSPGGSYSVYVGTGASMQAKANSGETIILAGGVDTLSWAIGSHGNASAQGVANSANTAGPKMSGIVLQVPGAGAAYDPLSSNLGPLGVEVIHGGSNALQNVLAAVFALGANFGANGFAFNTNPTAAGVTPGAITTAGGGDDPPATPEPTPLVLVAGGLLFALAMKRFDFGFSRG